MRGNASNQTQALIGFCFALLLALAALAALANPVGAQDSDTAPEPPPADPATSEEAGSDANDDGSVSAFVVFTEEHSTPGRRLGSPATGGPVYACYFAEQFIDASGATRFGDDFIPDTAGPDLVPGNFYARQCLDDLGNVADFGIIEYQPLGEGGIVTELTVVLERAVALELSAEPPDLSPEAQQITGIETWFNSPQDPFLEEELALGPITVGLRARLVAVEIDPGDGSAPFSCDPTNFIDWSTGVADTECSHTYIDEPDSDAYRGRITYSWEYDWRPHIITGLPPTEADWVPNFAQGIAAVEFDVEVIDLEAVITQ